MIDEDAIRERMSAALRDIPLHDGKVAVEDGLKAAVIDAAVAELARLTRRYAERAESYHAFNLAADMHKHVHRGEPLTYDAAVRIFRAGAGMVHGLEKHEANITLVGMLARLKDRGLPVASADKDSLCGALAAATKRNADTLAKVWQRRKTTRLFFVA